MKRLGAVLHKSKHGFLILRSNFAPSIGEKVYDNSGKPVGEIYDVFGPITKPYISVKLNREFKKKSSHFVRETLYILRKGKR